MWFLWCEYSKACCMFATLYFTLFVWWMTALRPRKQHLRCVCKSCSAHDVNIRYLHIILLNFFYVPLVCVCASFHVNFTRETYATQIHSHKKMPQNTEEYEEEQSKRHEKKLAIRKWEMKSKKERTNGRRKMNRFYKAKCVCELWAPNAFSWFSSELWWVVGISPKMMPFKGAQNTRKCYLSMLFTNIHTLYASYHTVSIVPSSDQFSHTPGLYGNTKQMQCVAECRWNVFSSEMCEFVHASTGDSCAANTKCVYVLIFISMNHRRRRMKISSISWIEPAKNNTSACSGLNKRKINCFIYFDFKSIQQLFVLYVIAIYEPKKRGREEDMNEKMW